MVEMTKVVSRQDMEYAVAGVGSFVGTLVNQAVPALNGHGIAALITGVVAIFVGAWVKHDGLGAFLVGFGVPNVALGLYDIITGHM